MKVLGNRAYLLLPEMPDSKIELSPETKRQLESEMVQKYDKLTVYAVGPGNGLLGTSDEIKAGDVVFADPNACLRGTVIKIDDKKIIVISKSDILHIWN